MKNKGLIVCGILVIIGLVMVALFLPEAKNKKKNVKEKLLGIDYNVEGNDVSLNQYNTEKPHASERNIDGYLS